jgi:hypothetical protein
MHPIKHKSSFPYLSPAKLFFDSDDLGAPTPPATTPSAPWYSDAPPRHHLTLFCFRDLPSHHVADRCRRRFSRRRFSDDLQPTTPPQKVPLDKALLRRPSSFPGTPAVIRACDATHGDHRVYCRARAWSPRRPPARQPRQPSGPHPSATVGNSPSVRFSPQIQIWIVLLIAPCPFCFINPQSSP